MAHPVEPFCVSDTVLLMAIRPDCHVAMPQQTSFNADLKSAYAIAVTVLKPRVAATLRVTEVIADRQRIT